MTYTGDQYLHPVLLARLDRLRERAPFNTASGWRSAQSQQQLWDAHQRDPLHNPPANRPGTSNHNAIPYGKAMALAADIHPLDGDYGHMHDEARKVGLHFPIASEPWHVEPIELPTPGHWGGNPFPDSPIPPIVHLEETDMNIAPNQCVQIPATAVGTCFLATDTFGGAPIKARIVVGGPDKGWRVIPGQPNAEVELGTGLTTIPVESGDHFVSVTNLDPPGAGPAKRDRNICSVFVEH